jgi:hypothetical protein
LEESKKYFKDGERRAGHAPLRPTRTPHGLLPLRRGGSPPLRRDWSLIKNKRKNKNTKTPQGPRLFRSRPFPSVHGGRKTNMPARSGLLQSATTSDTSPLMQCGCSTFSTDPPSTFLSQAAGPRAERAAPNVITASRSLSFFFFLPAAHSAEPSKILPAPPAPEAHIGGTRHKS